MPGHAGRWRVVYHKNNRYLISENGGQVLAHKRGTLRAVSATGRVNKKIIQIAGRGKGKRVFRWLDKNGDGLPQGNEFTFSKSRSYVGGGWVTEDLTFITGGALGNKKNIKLRIAETKAKWSKYGPYYPIGDEKGLGVPVAFTSTETRCGSRGRGTYRSFAGNYYAHFNDGRERHGSGWPTYWGGRSRLVKWDGKGNEQWQVGRHAIHGGLGGKPHTTPNGYMHVPAEIIGETKQTVIMADRVENIAMNWTKDGLYVGDFFDGRVKDGLPEKIYYWWRTPDRQEAITTSDNAQGGRAIQRKDGTVLWFVQGRNSVPVYKIHGWKNWERHKGSLTLKQKQAHAVAKGTGLRAAYYSGTELSGRPRKVRIDKQVWGGIPRGKRKGRPHDNVIDSWTRPVLDWSDGVKALNTKSNFSVRWSGWIEAPLTESYTFSIYKRGGARLWIDGKQCVFAWNETKNHSETKPFELQAGKRYKVQVDFFSTHKYPACSLNWESKSLDRRRVPARYLYPAKKDKWEVAKLQARPATMRISAISFTDSSKHVTDKDVRGNTVRGLRQRGFGVTGAYLKYKDVNFGQGVKKLKAKVTGTAAGKGKFDVVVEWRVGSPTTGRTIAKVSLKKDSDKGPVHEVSAKGVRGVHDVYVVNTTKKRWHFVKFYWFEFE